MNPALDLVRQQIANRDYPRRELSEILVNYNNAMGNNGLAIDNARRLTQSDAVCVVTGQQLGFMGGPLFTILKAVTCILMARDLNAIPVFWVATEDHDIDEICNAYIVDPVGNLQRFHLAFHKGPMVEELLLMSRHYEVIKNFWEALGRSWPVSGSYYCEAMMRLLTQLFAGTGMVFLEPKLLRPLATSFFVGEIEEAEGNHEVLQTTWQDIEKAGGTPMLSVHEPTNIFMNDPAGRRTKVRVRNGNLEIGNDIFSKRELVDVIQKRPRLFSPNAAARPLLQSHLIPTLAYAAGPNEILYYRQLEAYHRYRGVPMPLLVPRVSATLLTPEATSYLEALKLSPEDTIPERWSEQGLPPNVPTHALHLLRNLLHPQSKRQERVLNGFYFEAHSKTPLVPYLLQQCNWREPEHRYIAL